MTVKQIVSYLRGLLKEHDSSKGPFTDKFLWETFNTSAKDVFSNLRLRRFNVINPANYVTVCMELIPGISHECGCIERGCPVLVTKHELPRFTTSRNTISLKASTLGHSPISIFSEEAAQIALKYDKTFKRKPLASLINNKLVIWNTKDLEVIRVKAIWEDVTDLDNIQYCDNDSPNQPDCLDVYNIDIGVDKDLVHSIIMGKVLPLLNVPKQLQEDLNNDSNPEIRS